MLMSAPREVLVRKCWEAGRLSYKLRDYQVPLYNTLIKALDNKDCYKYVVNCSRRFGKSTILMLISFEQCIRRKGIDVRFTTDTGKHMKEIIASIQKEILNDCPTDCIPFYSKSDGKFHFNNGSTLHTYGADNGIADGQRGVNSHLNIIDEAGFISDLDETLHSIILPQCDTTGGKTFMISTPSTTPGHDFYKLALEAEIEGYYSKYTMDDNTFYSQEKKEEIFKSRGGRESTRVKREYFGEWVVEEELMVIPEWKDQYIQEIPKDEFYQYYHKYVSMDLGVKDFTAPIFGYYDFKQCKLIIEDELTLNGPSLTTKSLRDAIVNKEKELWAELSVYNRISDNNNLLLVQDLGNMHQLYFTATSKDSLEAMINETRMMINEGKVLINPRCKRLIGCVKNAIWDKHRKGLDRNKTYGHFDHLMALVYLIRNLDKVTNPIPRLYNVNHYDNLISPNYNNQVNPGLDPLVNMFSTIKKR